MDTQRNVETSCCCTPKRECRPVETAPVTPSSCACGDSCDCGPECDCAPGGCECSG
jgi:hypothetical protein